jgi:O-methyltransferase domain
LESVPPAATPPYSSTSLTTGTTRKSVHILRNVRAAMNPDAKLLIVKAVVPDDDREHLSKLLDLETLVAASGRERT